MFTDILKYNKKGSFDFKLSESLSKVCTAPKQDGGVYLIYTINDQDEKLIYIGCSGCINQDGTFHPRMNGMYDRIVNGKQFEAKRSYSWPIKMKEDNINFLRIKWYITFDTQNKHIPAYVESLLLQKYFEENGCLPIWNNTF